MPDSYEDLEYEYEHLNSNRPRIPEMSQEDKDWVDWFTKEKDR